MQPQEEIGEPVTHAIRIYETGGPEVLRWDPVDVGQPGPGEVRIRHTAIGVDYADIYYRVGVYPAEFPIVPGHQAAGVVEDVGPEVASLTRGDRVAYVTRSIGSYSEARVIHSRHLVKLPDEVSDTQAAAIILKGMTVRYLLLETYRVKPDDTILVHAAAGGVGLLLCQWARSLGATVIGTVSNDEKASLAKAHGCTHTIDYTREDFVERVIEITGGRKVPVVYDSVGKDTFMKSLDCLAPEGVMVLFGHSSGKVPPFELMLLAAKGSLYVTRPTLWSRLNSRDDLVSRATEVFKMLRQGLLRITINQTFPLKDAGRAHLALESRNTSGAVILSP
jgi:NADPH:quinone reductase